MTNARKIIPGLILALVLAVASIYAAELPLMKHFGLSALTLSIVGGMIIGNTFYKYIAEPSHEGINFSKQKLLRLGIILFGFKLTFQDIAAVGISGVIIDALVLSSTFALAYYIGRKRFGMDEQSAILIGAGSSICGAAAVLATEPVLKAHADKVAVAVATVVVFGTLAMFLYPVGFEIFHHYGLSQFAYGVFAGSTIHEVAQVVAAGRSVGEVAANSAVITKMIRVMMLAPFLVIISAWMSKKHSSGQANKEKSAISIPWFAVLFLVAAGFNSFNLLPHSVVAGIISFDNLMLAMAMGALGITTHISAIRRAGVKPLALASILFVWLIVGGTVINFGVRALI